MSYNDYDRPNKGLGQYLIVFFLALIEGCYRYGFGWFGLKAILFTLAVFCIFAIGAYILEIIIEKFKE